LSIRGFPRTRWLKPAPRPVRPGGQKEGPLKDAEVEALSVASRRRPKALECRRKEKEPRRRYGEGRVSDEYCT
jgi:hypothetical protein